MIRILKLGNIIYENFEPKQLIPVYDEDGNIVDYQEVWTIPTDIDTLKQAVIDTLIWLEKQRVNKILERFGYLSMADVLFYAQDPDSPHYEEAKMLMERYKEYDNAIWEFIENLNPRSIDDLLELDLIQIEESVFNRVAGRARDVVE